MAWAIKKSIVVPFDFSVHSHSAVDKALELADSPSLVHVVHVLPPIVPFAPEGIDLENVDEPLRMENTVRSLEKEFSDSRYSEVMREVLVGDVGTVCSERAKALNAELIVLPSHGRSGISHLLLGSQAERIVRHAKCPVLILKIHS